MPAAFRFYHDHRMGLTARNNWYGLQGMFLVTDPAERKLGLPRGAYDVPLHLTDRSLDDENQLTDTFPGPHMHDWMTGAHAPPNDATVGKRILVNGQFAPYLTVRPGPLPAPAAQRLHVLGLRPRASRTAVRSSRSAPAAPCSPARSSAPTSSSARPSARTSSSTSRGCATRTCCCPPSRATTARHGTGSRSAAIMQFRVRGAAHPSPPVPDVLRPVPALDVPDEVAKVWTFGLTEDHHGSFWSINGEMFDPKRVDHQVVQGTTERWRLRNTSDMTHYVHLHEEQWQTISRNGKRPPPWERGFEDTWRLDPASTSTWPRPSPTTPGSSWSTATCSTTRTTG